MQKRDLKRDVKALEGLPPVTLPEPQKLCGEHLDLALSTVGQVDESLTNLEQSLRALGQLTNDFTLVNAVIGAIGISTTEIRSYMPSLREAVKDAGEES